MMSTEYLSVLMSDELSTASVAIYSHSVGTAQDAPWLFIVILWALPSTQRLFIAIQWALPSMPGHRILYLLFVRQTHLSDKD